MANHNPSSDPTASLKPLLLGSLAHYLERNGFSKTLKKFRSEAQIEKDGLKGSPPDLEEVYKKYLESRYQDPEVNYLKEQVKQKDILSKTNGEHDSAVVVESVSKKKKKKNNDTDGHVAVDQSGIANAKKLEETITNDAVTGLNIKSKEKKKSKKISDSLDQGNRQVSVEVPSEEPNKKEKALKKKSKVVPESVGDNVESQSEEQNKGVSKSEKKNKSKDKKKRAENLTSDSPVDNSKDETDDIQISKVDVATEETKASKKRKRVASGEDDSQLVAKKPAEESISRKTEIDASSGKENKGENGQVGPKDTEKTPMKMVNGQGNGNVEKSLEKVSKRQRIGSAEPTSLKAFQRVKIDEVVFTDERLQDNSYWAKDGAEIGYGAKAQEVLGQVRGRDFRHEKTKKKRGSYRGGQIDLGSHSVKFNYSDKE